MAQINTSLTFPSEVKFAQMLKNKLNTISQMLEKKGTKTI
jgi:hypothetical protein